MLVEQGWVGEGNLQEEVQMEEVVGEVVVRQVACRARYRLSCCFELKGFVELTYRRRSRWWWRRGRRLSAGGLSRLIKLLVIVLQL